MTTRGTNQHTGRSALGRRCVFLSGVRLLSLSDFSFLSVLTLPPQAFQLQQVGRYIRCGSLKRKGRYKSLAKLLQVWGVSLVIFKMTPTNEPAKSFVSKSLCCSWARDVYGKRGATARCKSSRTTSEALGKREVELTRGFLPGFV